jgi:hydrogenase maturation protease
MMTSRRQALVVMGLGNILWGDDGLGVAAVGMLARRFDAPEGARVLDGGTLGLALLPIIQDAERVLLIDAIRVGDAAPGALVRIEGDEVAPAVRERLSPHQVGVADLLDAARLLDCYPERLVLLGMVPQRLDLGFGLSAVVERQLDRLVNRVVDEALGWGYAFRARAGSKETLRGGAGDHAGDFRLRK